jgi:hypothetical protein
VQQSQVVVARLRREALDVRERRAVDVEDPVELGALGECEEPLLLFLREVGQQPIVRIGNLRAISRRLEEPALPVAANPGGVGELPQAGKRLERPRTRGAVVAAEEPALDPERLRVVEHGLECRQVAVDVVQDSEHQSAEVTACSSSSGATGFGST